MWLLGNAKVLATAPRIASWNRHDHPEQVALRGYLREVGERGEAARKIAMPSS